MTALPEWRFIGWGELWRCNGTGVAVLYILFLPVWRRSFFHSTAMFE